MDYKDGILIIISLMVNKECKKEYLFAINIKIREKMLFNFLIKAQFMLNR